MALVFEIELHLLKDLYQQLFLPETESFGIDVPKWLDLNKYDAAYPRFLMNSTHGKNLLTIKNWDTDKRSWLTAVGVDYLERNQLVETHQITANMDARLAILSVLIEVSDNETPNYAVAEEDLHQIENFRIHTWYLISLGLAARGLGTHDHWGPNLWITHEGRHFFASHLIQKEFRSVWEDLKTNLRITPQQRGRHLESLLISLWKYYGIDAQKSVAPDEENDLIVSIDFSHFVVSCKWEKKPAKTDYINSLLGRIGQRPGSCGLLASAGGFSKELPAYVEKKMAQGLIILFGPKDIDQLFHFKISPLELLKSRQKVLVVDRKAVFE